MGFASSRRDARQLVSHRHFAVNGRTVNISSYHVRVGEEIAVRGGSKDVERIKTAIEAAEHRSLPPWLNVDREQLTGKMVSQPERNDIDQTIQEQLIVEFYSR